MGSVIAQEEIMKRVLIVVLLTLVCLSMAACSQTGESMVIKPSTFSEETESVLEIFGDEVMFYDFEVDDTIKTVTIAIWLCNDGEWVENGALITDTDVQNQIAIQRGDSTYDIYTMGDEGFVESASIDVNQDFEDTIHQASWKMDEPVNILAGQEITLWTEIGNNSEGISITENFRESDCTEGIAISVVFSDK